MTYHGHMPVAPAYPIRAVSRMTGLSIDTLRAWERRYEAVVPARGARGRVYSDSQIERLRLLAALVEGGHAIGTIAGLSDTALRKLRGPASSAAAPLTLQGDTALQQALDRYDVAAIEA